MRDPAPPLSQLESAGLIRLASVAPEREYLFRHALVQDAAYASLLRSDRKRLHRAAGEVLEQIYQGRQEEIAALLGQHFAQAGEDGRALHYLTLAGDQAADKYANAEAVAHYTAALARAGAASGAALIHLYSRRGRALELAGRYAEALANYESMAGHGQAHGDGALELAALIARTTIYATATSQTDPAQGQVLAAQALTLARQLGDRAGEARIFWNLMLIHGMGGIGDPGAALTYGEQSLALARELALTEQVAQTLNDLAYVYSGAGQPDRARACLDEAGDLWRGLGNLPMLADNRINCALSSYLAGAYAAADTLAAEGYELSRRIGNNWCQAFSSLTSATICLEIGDLDRARAANDQAVRLGEMAGFLTALVFAPACQAVAYAQVGAIARARDLAEHALATAEARIPRWRPLALAGLALVLVLGGDPPAATRTLQECRQTDVTADILSQLLLLPAEGEVGLEGEDYVGVIQRMDAFCDLHVQHLRPQALYYQGRALLAQGHAAAADALWAQAQQEATAMGGRRALWPILAARARLAAAQGRAAAAHQLHQAARPLVAYIADHAGAADVRAAFLGLPAVQAIQVAAEDPA